MLTVHRHVHGTSDDGQPYDANDPHLLLWVHCAEIYMFLAAHRRFGAVKLSDQQADQYVEEMVPLAYDLGVSIRPAAWPNSPPCSRAFATNFASVPTARWLATSSRAASRPAEHNVVSTVSWS